MRTFVAVELDDACRGALVGAVEQLRPEAAGVRWVRPQAMHLTLKFIGEMAEADLPRALECLKAPAAEAKPFVMRVGGLSAFPARGRPRVIHVEVQEPGGALIRLQGAVDRAIADELGVAAEKRAYVPHVTLGRVKDPRACPPVAEMAAVLSGDDFGDVSVDSFVLMKSDLRPTGAVYTALHRFALGQ